MLFTLLLVDNKQLLKDALTQEVIELLPVFRLFISGVIAGLGAYIAALLKKAIQELRVQNGFLEEINAKTTRRASKRVKSHTVEVSEVPDGYNFSPGIQPSEVDEFEGWRPSTGMPSPTSEKSHGAE